MDAPWQQDLSDLSQHSSVWRWRRSALQGGRIQAVMQLCQSGKHQLPSLLLWQTQQQQLMQLCRVT